eukprot:5468120-Amphidinium_carterae.1
MIFATESSLQSKRFWTGRVHGKGGFRLVPCAPELLMSFDKFQCLGLDMFNMKALKASKMPTVHSKAQQRGRRTFTTKQPQVLGCHDTRCTEVGLLPPLDGSQDGEDDDQEHKLVPWPEHIWFGDDMLRPKRS